MKKKNVIFIFQDSSISNTYYLYSIDLIDHPENYLFKNIINIFNNWNTIHVAFIKSFNVKKQTSIIEVIIQSVSDLLDKCNNATLFILFDGKTKKTFSFFYIFTLLHCNNFMKKRIISQSSIRFLSFLFS